jgi:accessory gene regulator B
MIDKLTTYITNLIYETKPDTEASKREIIEYGVFMTLSEIIKITFIIIIGAISGLLSYVLGCIAALGVQRTVLGGTHAKSHTGCLVIHLTSVFSIVLVSIAINVDKLYILLPIAAFCYIAAIKYAPADVPEKPIKSAKQRKMLKAAGLSEITVLFSVSLFVPAVWSNIIMFSCLVQAFFLTPLAYRLTKNKYSREEVIT